jgi:hypothetical protein
VYRSRGRGRRRARARRAVPFEVEAGEAGEGKTGKREGAPGAVGQLGGGRHWPLAGGRGRQCGGATVKRRRGAVDSA